MPILVKKSRHLVTKRMPGGMVTDEHDTLSLHNAQGWNVIHLYLFEHMSWASKQVIYHRKKSLSGHKEINISQNFQIKLLKYSKSATAELDTVFDFRCYGEAISKCKTRPGIGGRNKENMLVYILPGNFEAWVFSTKTEVWVFFNSQKKINWSLNFFKVLAFKGHLLWGYT